MKRIAGSLLALLVVLSMGWPHTAAARTRQFLGAINGKLRIVMTIDINGGSVDGSYYYEKYKTDIRLQGSIDAKGNLSLTEFDPKDGKISGTFVGKFVNSQRLEGKWIKGDGSKTFPFWLEENAD